MELFLDCEWADSLASELVSIALISADDRHVFYAERDPLPLDSMPWVRTVVYPVLERGLFAMDDASMTQRLRQFLDSIPNPAICYDSGHDRPLCRYVIESLIRWFHSHEISNGPGSMDWFNAPNGGGRHPELRSWRHHARSDAMALRGAYMSSKQH